MNHFVDQAKQRRRGRAEAEFRAGSRQAGMQMPRTQVHHMVADATRSQMQRSPAAARIGVVFGGVLFVAAIVLTIMRMISG